MNYASFINSKTFDEFIAPTIKDLETKYLCSELEKIPTFSEFEQVNAQSNWKKKLEGLCEMYKKYGILKIYELSVNGLLGNELIIERTNQDMLVELRTVNQSQGVVLFGQISSNDMLNGIGRLI